MKMELVKIIQASVAEHQNTIETLIKNNCIEIEAAGKICASSLLNGGTIFWCGNGGSASESQHMATELIGRFKKNRIPLKSISLNSDTAALTCIANDFGYENIFSRQLEGLGKPGDVLIVLSTSGNSQNINNALIKAKELSISSIAMLGKGGGESLSIAKTVILIDSNSTARVQESHQLISHILCELIEAELGYE
jgi:D-sedoheptulose 7-phosphate isomerase